MRFSQLCAEAGVRPAGSPGDAEVRRVVTDSRDVQEGDCFVAVRGTAADGHAYLSEAVAKGCAAVVCEDATAVPPDVPRALVDDTRAVVGRLAQAAAGWPCRRLAVVGVTGTNGKTTFSYLLRHVLEAAGHRTGLIGTVAYDTLDGTTQATNTTPGPVATAGMMARLVRAGATHLVMEVSSHALDQRRTDGIEFDVAVFTNLSGDHLDYHGSMSAYLAAKRRLFDSLAPPAAAVVNRDDPRADEVLAGAHAGVRRLWYGFSSAADLYAEIDRIDATGSRFALRFAGASADVTSALVGRHNVYNALAAAGAAMALGLDLDRVAAALGEVRQVPGRLQRVAADAPFDVLVDYAHTDDALRNVLSALRPVTAGRLILVFGCGGDRDRGKRPRMARAAENGADVIVVTSDNPRGEDPADIIDEIVGGFSPTGLAKATVEPSRRDAIAAAIGAAEAGDVVLIAGKGHEDYQIIGDRRIHFDDVETARDILLGK